MQRYLRELSELTEYDRSSQSEESEGDVSDAQEKHSTALHSQDQPEESKQSEVSSPLFSADVPVLE